MMSTGEQQQHESSSLPQSQQGSGTMDTKKLEGTLICRIKGKMKKMRMYTVFDMSGAAGASLEVGGIGGLKCYRFTGLSKRETATAYSSTRYINSGEQQSKIDEYEQRELCIDIPGHLPWNVWDVENDPTAFVVKIAISGLDLIDQQNHAEVVAKSTPNSTARKDIGVTDRSEAEVDEDQSVGDEDGDDEGVFDFWGGDDDDESDAEQDEAEGADNDTNTPANKRRGAEPQDLVKGALLRAVARKKEYAKIEFRCQSSNNEKAVWLAAFNKVGRLSGESKRKKNLFGATPQTTALAPKASQRLSRMRAASSFDKRMFVSQRFPSSGAESDAGEEEGNQKEYCVRPNYNYMHQWMTHGELTDEMEAPSKVLFDTRLSPTVVGSRELGLLRVEVLQCLGLPTQRGRDPNTVVYLACGSYAFTTDVIEKCQSPMWLRGMRRACAIPIYHGYASLMAGVFSASKGPSSKDTFVGRVEIPIAQMRPNSRSYDVTLPLRASNNVYTRKKLGALRLRISLEYYDGRQAISSYLPHKRNKFKTTIACADPKSFRNVALTVHGTHLLERFSPDLLMAAIRELTYVQAATSRMLKTFILDLMSWKHPIYSGYCFFSWMHCVYINSMPLVPAYFVGLLLLNLVDTYNCYVAGAAADFQPLSWKELILIVCEKSDGTSASNIMGAKRAIDSYAESHLEFPFAAIGGYKRFSVEECLNDTKQRSGSDDNVVDDEIEVADDGLAGANDNQGKNFPTGGPPLPEQDLDVKVPAKDKKVTAKDKTIEQELQEAEYKVHKATKFLFDYKTYHESEGKEPPFGKKVSVDKDTEIYNTNQELDRVLGVGQFSSSGLIGGKISKLTSQITPLQKIISVVLSLIRSIYSIFTWRDPVLTFCFSIASMVLIVVLIIFPWRMVLLVVGFVLFGPQNWLARVFKERFLSDKFRPGRILRALKELFKDDEGELVYSKKKQLHGVKTKTPPQPIFRCHAPASNPLFEGKNTIGTQHIIVPYSPLYFNRFSDFPPDPQFATRLSYEIKFNETRCKSSSDIVFAPELPKRKRIPSAEDITTGADEPVGRPTTPNPEKGPENDSHNPDVLPKPDATTEEVVTPPPPPQNPQQGKAEEEIKVDDKASPALSETKGKNHFEALTAKIALLKNRLPNKPSGIESSPDNLNDDRSNADGTPLGEGIPSITSKFALLKNRLPKMPSGIESSPGNVNDDRSNADGTPLGEGIPSIIETISKEHDNDEVSEATGWKSEDVKRVSISKQLSNGNINEVPGCSESVQQAIREEDKVSNPMQDDGNEDKEEHTDREEDGQEEITMDEDSNKDEKIDTFVVPATTTLDETTQGAPSNNEENGPGIDPDDADDQEDDFELKPCPSNDSAAFQLQQLLAIKLELATARTENDNFRKQLKEVEVERDMYKERCEREKNPFNLFSPKRKAKDSSN